MVNDPVWLKRLIAVLLAVLLLFGGVVQGQTLDLVRGYIEAYYLFPIPAEALNAQTPKAMVDALGDPHSAYMTAKEFQDFIGGINLDFVGIGIFADKVSDGVLIQSVIEGSGAEAAGLRAGDVILRADGVDLSGMLLNQAIALIRGPEGTTVRLTVRRGTSVFEAAVQRMRVRIPTVTHRRLDDIGYIRLYSFGDTTPELFKQAYFSLKRQGVRGYVVDVRNNPGGYLGAVIELLSYFLGSQTALIARDKHGIAAEYAGAGSVVIQNKPLVVLMNGFSASASEIFAAALKDYEQALLVGETTFGKGTVQSLFLLPEGDALKLTVEQFFSPKDRPIHRVGVIPHVVMGDEAETGAMLLLGRGPAQNQLDGFLRIRLGGKRYFVDLEAARRAEHWQAFRGILAGYRGSMEYGAGDRWLPLPEPARRAVQGLFPEYRVLNRRTLSEPERGILLPWDNRGGRLSVRMDGAELIDAETGTRVSVRVSMSAGYFMRVVPLQGLRVGKPYYLVLPYEMKQVMEHGLVLPVTWTD